ncbi:MAG: pyruvate kinase [Eubacterium sp.]|nr:pyruvate kinase [Eubacterium sp.]
MIYQKDPPAGHELSAGDRRLLKIYGTLGPSCLDVDILKQMFESGMTGMRLNLSHISLKEASYMIDLFHRAADKAQVSSPDLLIDMQGPELRIGDLDQVITMHTADRIILGEGGIPTPDILFPYLKTGQQILLDDGKILLEVLGPDKDNRSDPKDAALSCQCKVKRGGNLSARKSIALMGVDIRTSVLTGQDLMNLKEASGYGVTGIMQPFVRGREDLMEVRAAMQECGCSHLSLFAKIENKIGISMIRDYLDLADEIVIARGDLGNAMPLWELPGVQKDISEICSRAGKPFMVVTQMLASMEYQPLPTRAEVSDIFNAVADGAASIMVTGETAIGKYPVEVIHYLANTAKEAVHFRKTHGIDISISRK